MAAAYGFHIAMNHAFRDGNKRTAFACMVAFLRMNGWNLQAEDPAAADLILELIEQHRDKAWLGARLAQTAKPRSSLELRDFFNMFSPDVHFDQICAFGGSNREETLATLNEAEGSMPVISHLVQRMEATSHAGNVEANRLFAAKVHLLMSLYRIAEDMGYEW